jgi:hypothetical protein
VAGEANGDGSYTYVPDPPTTGVPPISDPLAGMFTPPVWSDTPPPTDSPTDSPTIDPGTYRDLVTEVGQTVTLNPGTYVITGSVAPGKQGTIQGTGVTLYFPNGASMSLGDDQALDISAPTTGTYAHLAVYSDKVGPPKTVIDFGAGADVSITGTIYAPAAELRIWAGSGTKVISAGIIVNNVVLGGSPTLTLNYDSSQNVQPPPVTTKTPPNLLK